MADEGRFYWRWTAGLFKFLLIMGAAAGASALLGIGWLAELCAYGALVGGGFIVLVVTPVLIFKLLETALGFVMIFFLEVNQWRSQRLGDEGESWLTLYWRFLNLTWHPDVYY
jgi:hypothetical protein